MNIVVFGLIGLAIGSFLNVLIDRLPRGENVVLGRSHCDWCRRKLEWYELIPVLSFLVQKGRCRRCRRKLSWQYPLVELATGVGFALQGQAFDAHQGPALWGSLVLLSSLLVIFVADLKYQIIPDSMVVIGIIGILLQGQAFDAHQGPALWLSALGVSVFFLFLWLITRGRGIGLGDVKLGFLLGLLLGFPAIIVGLYVAFLTGAAVGVILILGGAKKLKSRIAFGPFLVIGTLVALVWSDQILAWWRMLL